MNRVHFFVSEHAVLRWRERIALDEPSVAEDHILRIALEGVISRDSPNVGGRWGFGTYFARHESYPDAIVVLRDSHGVGRFHAVTVLSTDMQDIPLSAVS